MLLKPLEWCGGVGIDSVVGMSLMASKRCSMRTLIASCSEGGQRWVLRTKHARGPDNTRGRKHTFCSLRSFPISVSRPLRTFFLETVARSDVLRMWSIILVYRSTSSELTFVNELVTGGK